LKIFYLDLLRKLESNPEYTQRELSREMGISLGKVNYCLQSLIEKGFVKMNNFKNNKNKLQYSLMHVLFIKNSVFIC